MTVHPGLSSGEGRNHGLPRPVPGKCERLNELLNQPRRYRHIDSNIKRRVPMRVKERAQQEVPQHGRLSIIRVRLPLIPTVVPAMLVGSVEHVIEHSARHVDIAMG